MIAARNGWRLAKIEAREGPTRSIAVNQRRFVSTSGPTTANAKPAQASHPMSKLWSPNCGDARRSRATETTARKTALSRNGEYLRMSGAIATEYAPHVAAPSTASRSPLRFEDTLLPEPAVTRTTPAKERDAAIQKRRPSRSIPTRREIRAVKIGSVPK